MDRPIALTVSPDGKHLDVATFNDHSVVAFARDYDSGALTFVAAFLVSSAGYFIAE